MADVTVAATSVAPIEGSTNIQYGILGGTVTAGQTVYLDSVTNTYKLADANASALTAAVKGVALNGGASGQPVAVATSGTYTCGFTAAVGALYVLSATPGGIAPAADLLTGLYTSILGVGITAATMRLNIINSGVAVP